MNNRREDADDATVYKVVVNHEDQYSIWPERMQNPSGWTSVGFVGPKADCVSHIESVWTDMRPRSLREAMENASAAVSLAPETRPAAVDEETLASRLSCGPQPVELALRRARTLDELIRQINAGCVYVRFTGTRGGTELPVALEPAAAERLGAQIANGEATLQIAGGLTLDYIPVRCVAEIDRTTFQGTGGLESAAR